MSTEVWDRTKPIFSVLVPVWHPQLDHLRECIQSVIDQTTDAWELILVADGPQPDGVIESIEEFSDSRILMV